MDIDSTSSNKRGSDVIIPTNGPSKLVRQVLQNIYRDLDRLPGVSAREAFFRLQAVRHTLRSARRGYSLRRSGPYYRKLGTLVKNLGWHLFSYLALAPGFQDAVGLLKDKHLEELLITLGLNEASFIIFCKVRGIHFNTRLLTDISMYEEHGQVMPYGDLSDPFPFIVKNSDVHRYIVPSEGREVKLNTKPRISENTFNAMNWFAAPEPTRWPHGIPFPSDPSLRRIGSECWLCQSPFHCACYPEQEHKEPLLVELRNYGNKGNGIRALQSIPKDTILGEYVGTFVPLTATHDPMYFIGFDAATKYEEPRNVAIVDAKEVGNWTRFINHSCNANSRYILVAVGKKLRVLVQSVRRIRLYEEVTADYGDEYFSGGLLCHCGYSHCRFPSPD